MGCCGNCGGQAHEEPKKVEQEQVEENQETSDEE